MSLTYEFKRQLEIGKKGEEAVIRYLNSKEETVTVVDLSEYPEFQAFGIDAQWIYENSRNGIMYSVFFDVKTDLWIHKTDNIFVETVSTDTKRGCVLTTKAEEFMYLDPILGKLYRVPIAPLRDWYHKYGKRKEIKEIKNPDYTSEGVLISLEELRDILYVEAESIPPLEGIQLDAH